MGKVRSKFICQKCGSSFAKWAGRCENCGEWNTLLEQVVPTEAEAKSALAKGAVSGKKLAAVSINTIEPSDAGSRLSTGFPDFDIVLGGGFLLVIGGYWFWFADQCLCDDTSTSGHLWCGFCSDSFCHRWYMGTHFSHAEILKGHECHLAFELGH